MSSEFRLVARHIKFETYPRTPASNRRPVPDTRVLLHEGHDSAVSRRDAPESCQGSPSKIRGRRECRVRAAPAVSCASCTRKCAHEHTGSAEASGIPCVMALRLMPRSPRRRIRLVTVVGGFERLLKPGRVRVSHRRLGTSNGCQDHAVLPYAKTSFVLCACQSLTRFNPPCDRYARRRCRVHHIPSRVRDDARPPLLSERDGRS
jgi:hypothetical protein